MAADPYRYFRVEARDLLEQLGQGVLDLEKRAPSDDDIARMLRVAHTLKGAARVVKQPEIAEHTHTLEDLFSALRGSAVEVAREHINVMLTLLDQMGRRVAALAPTRDAGAASAAADTEEPLQIFRPDPQDVDSLVTGLAEAQAQLGALRPALDHADRIRHLSDLIGDRFARLGGREGMAAIDRPGLDRTRSMMDELRGRVDALERQVLDGVDQIEAELRQVSDAAARLRLVPASILFRFLERAARHAAHALGKRVTFEGRGGDVRLDTGVLAVVQGALLQVVRNAVAHGIEATASERRAGGKPPDGRVTVTVARRGKWVSFACVDDGRGIDFEAVRRMLRKTGLPQADREALDDDALVRRLLEGGISTSGTVTEVSGRGIGLDVVREAATRLRGDVTMRTEAGKGTTIDITVPLSIASFHALLVEGGGVVAAVPLEAVRGTLRVTRDQLVDTAQGGSETVHAGRSIPFTTLHRLLRPTESPPERDVVSASSAFVVEANGESAAVAVDRIVGIANVITRPLPDLAPARATIVGASLDTRGYPRLVLDPGSLVADAARAAWRYSDTPSSRLPILVVDDSLTTRMLEQSILESAGYEVHLASSGEEGLEKARAGRHALFLVDVEMPGMDGFTFIEQVRADPLLRAIPAILVTSRSSAEDQQRGRDAGAQGYIVKGEFDQGALLDRIRMLVP